MPLPEQTPSEEFTERVGETAAGAIVVPHLIATQDYRINQHNARKAVKDTRAVMQHLMMQGTGITDEQMSKLTDASDEMGDIIYTGDITVRPGTELQLGNSRIRVDAEPVKPSEPTPSPTTPAAPSTSDIAASNPPPRPPSIARSFAIPLLIAALAGGSGATAVGIWNWLHQSPSSEPTPQSDWKLGIKVHK